MRRSNWIFHPLSVAISATVAVVSYAAWARWRFPEGDLKHHYIYVLPIIVPFVAFLFDRGRVLREITLLQWILEVLVVGVSLLRMFGYVPFVSGHALFLSYAMVNAGSRLTRITATVVMLQVIYLKLFAWHDFISPVAGIVLGVLTAIVVRVGTSPETRKSWQAEARSLVTK
jgi:hypothetical protein